MSKRKSKVTTQAVTKVLLPGGLPDGSSRKAAVLKWKENRLYDESLEEKDVHEPNLVASVTELGFGHYTVFRYTRKQDERQVTPSEIDFDTREEATRFAESTYLMER